MIQRFEYSHELAWKVMKDYVEYQGISSVMGARDAIRQTLQMGLITDSRWMDTIRDRNVISHNYDDTIAKGIVANIIGISYTSRQQMPMPWRSTK